MKVNPSNLKTVSAAVKKSNQGIRKAGQTFKYGLTTTVIGAPEEEQNGQNTEGTRQRKIPDNMLRKISVEKTSVREKIQKHSLNEQSGQEIQRRQNVYMHGLKYVDGKRNVYSNKRGASNIVGEKTINGVKTATDAAAKGAKTAGKTAKRVASVAKIGAKGAAATAGVASGAATAGISTVATVAIAGAVRVAKRAASIAKEGLEVSAAGKNSSSKCIPGMNDIKTGKRSSGSKSKIGFVGVFIAILLLPMLLFSMFVAVFTPLAALHSNYDGGAGKAVSIVAVAEQELNTSDENIGGGKYKNWYGMDANWCAMFVSWCANQCGYIDSGIMPKTASVAFMKSWYEQHAQYHVKESGYEPRAGDVVVFLRGRSHSGLVVSYDPVAKIVTTIEGNTGSSGTSPYHAGSHIRQKQYPLTYETIDGYGSPNYPGT